MKYLNSILKITISCIGILFLFIIVISLIDSDGFWNNYLKEYSNVIIAFLTLLYVVLTYLILESNNKTIKEQLRPYVIVTMPTSGFEIFFSIKNYGKRPAFNVDINVEPDLDSIQQKQFKGSHRPLLKHAFIGPNQEFRNFFAASLVAFESSPREKINTIFTFHCNYSDSEGNKYSEKYSIDLSSYLYELKMLEKDTDYLLGEISSHLKKINENIEFLNGKRKN